jgi:hypothetical protein
MSILRSSDERDSKSYGSARCDPNRLDVAIKMKRRRRNDCTAIDLIQAATRQSSQIDAIQATQVLSG